MGMILLKAEVEDGWVTESNIAKALMLNILLKRKGKINSLTLHIKGNTRREYFLCEIEKGNEFLLQGHLEYINVCSAMSNVDWIAILLTLLELILGLTPLEIPLQ